MQKLSNIVFLILFAKILAVVLWWYLPDSGIEAKKNVTCQMPYQHIRFNSMLLPSMLHKAVKNRKKVVVTADINTLVLKGLYGNKDFGYVIVAEKRMPTKTSVIAVGESYKGYKLVAIYLDYVVFNKNGIDYKLKLQQNTKNSNNRARVTKVMTFEPEEKVVSRRDIKHYEQNFSEIWRDIAIDEIRKNGHIEGFRVQRVRPGSKMAELGLQKGDVIVEANNVKLSSYNAVMKLYKNIHNIDTIDLLIKRGNQEKEITYEIR
ncbi:General secretion pathway protein C [hydrothermal vent metagenome]|uniref:General secretion pathway protein C n=1 Tax=hydrothermal vent metagenome TaxID=652676 RepID=A0A1W1BWY6_9ZZZZ